jgi:hypothetical protein
MKAASHGIEVDKAKKEQKRNEIAAVRNITMDFSWRGS